MGTCAKHRWAHIGVPGIHPMHRAGLVRSREVLGAGPASRAPEPAPVACQNASTAVSADAWKRLKARDPMPVGTESYPWMNRHAVAEASRRAGRRVPEGPLSARRPVWPQGIRAPKAPRRERSSTEEWPT